MKLLDKPQTWACDVCYQPISCVEDGWVQWVHFGQYLEGYSRDLQLVHVRAASPLTESRFGCQFDSHAMFKATGGCVQSLHLGHLVGPNGLMMLLRLIHEGELPQNDVLELTKRLHIPGYEQARDYFDRAISAGAFEPNTPPGYYHQYQIEATLRYAEEYE